MIITWPQFKGTICFTLDNYLLFTIYHLLTYEPITN